MKTIFLSKFNKDLDKLNNPSIKNKVISVIEAIESSTLLSEIPNLKKLKGDKISYRIRVGDYRIGLFFENGIVELARIVHRKDIYNVFP